MNNHRFRCFFNIEVEGIPLGRVIFELFNDVCPKTCENFRALCTGEAGDGITTKKPLCYKGVKFHRVIKDFMIQAGDFSSGNGTGGESIYGGHFEDENFDLNHDTPFLLSMANKGKDTNGSQFFITTQPAPHLNGKHVVFGRVLMGEEVIVAIENLPVDNRSRPLQPAIISDCGELVLQRSGKTKTKEKKKKKKTEFDEQEEKRKKKKKKDRKQKQKKEDGSDKEPEEGEVFEETFNGSATAAVVGSKVMKPHPLIAISLINPDEIPEVPRNRFLDRGFQNSDNSRSRNEQQMRKKPNIRFYTRSGRKVKGRGSLRYRTPSRSRSRERSSTPVHWRQAQKRTVTLEKYERVAEREMEREKEIEERRKKRDERHQLRMDTEGGGDVRQSLKKRLSSKDDSLKDRFVGEDKTDGDWRLARQHTSKSNDAKSGVMKQVTDLRQKLGHGSNKENIEVSHEPDDTLDMDDNALDYEAPSDHEEDTEDSPSKELAAERKKISLDKYDKRNRNRMTRSRDRSSHRNRRLRQHRRDPVSPRRNRRPYSTRDRRSRSRNDRRSRRRRSRSRSVERSRRRSRSRSPARMKNNKRSRSASRDKSRSMSRDRRKGDKAKSPLDKRSRSRSKDRRSRSRDNAKNRSRRSRSNSSSSNDSRK